MPTAPHKKAKAKPAPKAPKRLHQAAQGLLLVLKGGKIDQGIYFGTTGHLLVADLDALDGLTPEERSAAILLGVGTAVATKADVEVILDGIINAPPKAPPAEAPTEPVEAPPETTPVDPTAVVADTPVEPAAPVVADPAPAPVPVADPTTQAAPVVEEEVTGPLPNPAATA